MKTFSPQTREAVLRAQHRMCGNEHCYNKILSAHHKFPNTKVNQRKYPLFLQSAFNLIFLCNHCHTHYAKYKINEHLVQVYEQYLQEVRDGKMGTSNSTKSSC